MDDSDVYEITLNVDVYLIIHNENILKKNMVLSALESVVKELDYYFNFQQTRKEKYEQIAHFLLFVLSFIFTKKEKQIESLLFFNAK